MSYAYLFKYIIIGDTGKRPNISPKKEKKCLENVVDEASQFSQKKTCSSEPRALGVAGST